MAVSTRMVGNAISLGVHAANAAYMLYTLRGDALKDKKVHDMQTQQFFYITIWNLIFQKVYLGVTILCYIQEKYKINDRGLLKPVRAYNQMFFDGIVIPCTFAIFVVFWPLFIYDRELLFPEFIDRAVGALPNYIMHAFIVPVVMWEMIFLPARRTSVVCGILHVSALFISYLTALLHNFNKRGLWPYPLVQSVYGTIYFHILMGFCLVLAYVGFFCQWPLRRMISTHKSNKSNKSQ